MSLTEKKIIKECSDYGIINLRKLEKIEDYKLVIKTTRNHKENFVKSLHLLNADRYNKY